MADIQMCNQKKLSAQKALWRDPVYREQMIALSSVEESGKNGSAR